MKVVIVGATGFVGKAMVQEASDRGLEVTAIARNTSKVASLPNVKSVSVDVTKTNALAEQFKGHDAIISAFNAGSYNPYLYQDFILGSNSIQQAAKISGVKRLLVIGGAGSLFLDGQQLVDTAIFPADWRVGASAARDYLNTLRKEQELDWTFLSPAIELESGERTGKFRLGLENPVFDANGKSRISVTDLAVAGLDEIEKPTHIKQRFTLGY